jgi:hypothetical protein
VIQLIDQKTTEGRTQSAARPALSPLEANPLYGVSYAAKSTLDPNGSNGTQLENGRTAADRAGIEIVAEFQDVNASAYHGNRDEGLIRMMTECER